jgi:SAM-dependent methyltransferase
MLFWILFVLFFIILAFCVVVVLGGPPYVPTFRKQIDTALDLLDLQEGETLLELGSGDGRVLLAAARRGLKVVGIELNPLLVLVSLLITWRYRKQVRVIWGNYWGKPWPRADGIFTFMLPKHMTRLDERIEKWHPKTICLATFAFPIPGKEPKAQRDNVLLYEYK